MDKRKTQKWTTVEETHITGALDRKVLPGIMSMQAASEELARGPLKGRTLASIKAKMSHIRTRWGL